MGKRYVVYFTGCVHIEAENVAQAAKHAKKYRMIGRAVGAGRSTKDRDPIRYERGEVTLKMGQPLRVVTVGGRDHG
jgi:hypothetical protein